MFSFDYEINYGIADNIKFFMFMTMTVTTIVMGIFLRSSKRKVIQLEEQINEYLEELTKLDNDIAIKNEDISDYESQIRNQTVIFASKLDVQTKKAIKTEEILKHLIKIISRELVRVDGNVNSVVSCSKKICRKYDWRFNIYYPTRECTRKIVNYEESETESDPSWEEGDD